jgi:hypothetical protein
MLNLRVLGFAGVACAAFAVSLFVSTPETAQARPQYAKEFAAKYTDLAEAAKKAKCAMCHPEKSKKVKNAYGKALGTAIGAKNCKDSAKIQAGLAGAESKPSEVEGKTFGDLIKAGKLPNAK